MRIKILVLIFSQPKVQITENYLCCNPLATSSQYFEHMSMSRPPNDIILVALKN